MSVIHPPQQNLMLIELCDPVKVMCRVCRDYGRRSSPLVVLTAKSYSDGHDPKEWGGLGIKGLANHQRYPTIAYECKNRSCNAIPRTTQLEMAERYKKAVAKRLDTIWI